MSEQSPWPSVQPGQLLGKSGVERLLVGCAPSPAQAASSVYLSPGGGPQVPAQWGTEGRAWEERLARLDRAILRSDTGLVALRVESRGLVILPPFPVPESGMTPGWNVAPLLKLLATEYTIGVVLLRLGRYAVGVYRGERLLASKTDTRYVKGRHRAGGTSQKRFERVREGQAHRLYLKACEAVQSRFGDFEGQLDYVLLGGDKFTLEGFLKVCPYLDSHRDKTLERRLNVREPNLDALQQAGGLLGQSRVYQWEW